MDKTPGFRIPQAATNHSNEIRTSQILMFSIYFHGKGITSCNKNKNGQKKISYALLLVVY